MAVLRIIRDGKELGRRELQAEVVIGREDGCAIRLNDTKVSRKHCRIERKPEGWIAIDLKSRNGTVVSGKPISEHALRHGDIIQIGAASLQFVADDAPLLDEEVLEMLNEPNSDTDIAEAVNESASGGVAVGLPEEAGAGQAHSFLPAEPSTEPAAQATEGHETMRPVPAAPAVTSPTASGDVPSRSPARNQVSLWDLASTKESPAKRARKKPSEPAAPTAKSQWSIEAAVTAVTKTQVDQRKWYGRQISLPAVVGASVAVLLVLWLIVFGQPHFGSGSSASGAMPKHLPHSSSNNND